MPEDDDFFVLWIPIFNNSMIFYYMKHLLLDYIILIQMNNYKHMYMYIFVFCVIFSVT